MMVVVAYKLVDGLRSRPKHAVQYGLTTDESQSFFLTQLLSGL